MKSALFLSAFMLLTLAMQDTPKATSKRPEVGKPAPAFRLNDHTGKIVPFGGKHEHWTVLAFFPKAATPG